MRQNGTLMKTQTLSGTGAGLSQPPLRRVAVARFLAGHKPNALSSYFLAVVVHGVLESIGVERCGSEAAI